VPSSGMTHAGSSIADFYTLKMEAIRSSETSVYTISTWRHIPEHGIHQEGDQNYAVLYFNVRTFSASSGQWV
jgi:hypothetical protein